MSKVGDDHQQEKLAACTAYYTAKVFTNQKILRNLVTLELVGSVDSKGDIRSLFTHINQLS